MGDLSVPLGLAKVADAIKKENSNAVVLMVRSLFLASLDVKLKAD